ncbi:glycosyltransferase family A protein, partial [Thermocatellispora tengchongensis]|uniref:glycosyltransferase family 2 protein n=1 Tax=Thermocatellispora tengchongensis TaxID=1073253 RepID=UPI0031ECE2C4
MEFARRVRIVRRQVLDRYRSLARRVHPEGDSGESSSADTALVSVVVPVHNAMPYLAELLESLEQQDMDRRLYEVIAVDDGSTDSGGRVLEAFAARNPNARVIHQPNSGWPGKPRNVGLAASRAEYVFFCDADDYLGPEALPRMVDYAQEHDVD